MDAEIQRFGNGQVFSKCSVGRPRLSRHRPQNDCIPYARILIDSRAIHSNDTKVRSLRYLFFSHDGYGLGHLRRNWLIASSVLERDPGASAVLVTGLPLQPPWRHSPRMSIVRVPPLLKDACGAYRATGIGFDEAIRRRERLFSDLVTGAPEVIVVDRHPYGTAGELRSGLIAARRAGARLVLGLRDVLDQPAVVKQEMAGQGWDDVESLFDEILVYGARHVCDHEREYGLSMSPRYCGWVVGDALPFVPEAGLLAVTAGGGGDGAAVFSLGVDALERLTDWRGYLAAGPYADAEGLRRRVGLTPARQRITIGADVDDCAQLFSRACAVLQMAGYNSTYEALAAGQRPILVPRRAPRQEQAIRAERLSGLGLCDVVPEGAHVDDVVPLLSARRQLDPGELDRAGLSIDGASRAASILENLALAARR